MIPYFSKLFVPPNCRDSQILIAIIEADGISKGVDESQKAD